MNDFELGLAPRPGGLTHVIDKGLGPRAWEDVLEVAGEKSNWGKAPAGVYQGVAQFMGYHVPQNPGPRESGVLGHLQHAIEKDERLVGP